LTLGRRAGDAGSSAVNPVEPQRAADDRIVIGSVNAVFGTRGWIKLLSETRPRDAIFDYPVWYVGDVQPIPFDVLEHRVQHNSLLARLRGVERREQAEALVGSPVLVATADLEPPPPGHYYWRDLIGLRVVTRDGRELGEVRSLVETGGADVLRVRGERERLIPFVPGVYVLKVDTAERRLDVDWHPDD
jgi:16S rRNA processing protein RimM